MRLRYFTVAILFGFGFQLQAQKSYQFSFQPKLGDSNILNYETNTHTVVKHSKGETTTDLSMVIEYDLFISSVTDSGYTIGYLYRSMQSTTKTRQVYNGVVSNSELKVGTEMDADDIEDSEQEDKIRTYKLYKLYIGKGYQLRCSKEGKVLEIMGLKELRKSLIKAIKEDWKSTSGYENLKSSIESSLSDESIKSTYEGSMGFYPKENVVVGQKWTSDSRTNSTNGTVEYTFMGMENDSTATIGLSMPFTLTQSPLKGNIIGTFKMNVNNGNAVYSKSTTTLKGKLKTDSGKMKVTSISETTTKLRPLHK